MSPDQQKAMDEQKAQCIFCKIIKGEVPSKKVYEDDKIIALLDINPATKGHLLVMPKDHYPIIPLIPQEVFKHLFSRVRDIDLCVKESLLCKETTIFIANGGAAGQQSTHFMLHVIPRDSGDSLDMLDIKGKETPENELREVFEKCQILNPMLQKNLALLGFIESQSGGAGGNVDGQAGMGVPQKVSKEQLLQIIETNPQLKQIIMQSPDQFKQVVPTHPQLKELFKNFDVDEIIEEVLGKSNQKKKVDLSGIE